MRFLLASIVADREIDFDNVSDYVSELEHLDSKGPAYVGANGGRLIKTHEPFNPLYRKAIYLVRNVNDVIFSEYNYFFLTRDSHIEFSDFFYLFRNGKRTDTALGNDT